MAPIPWSASRSATLRAGGLADGVVDHRTLAGGELEVEAHRLEQRQQVAEDDRRIDAVHAVFTAIGQDAYRVAIATPDGFKVCDVRDVDAGQTLTRRVANQDLFFRQSPNATTRHHHATQNISAKDFARLHVLTQCIDIVVEEFLSCIWVMAFNQELG